MSRTLMCAALLLALLTAIETRGDSRRVITFSLEQTTTLHVGDFAVLTVPPDHIYDRARRQEKAGLPVGGGALVTARLRGHRGEPVFRAVRPGPAAFVIGPDVPDGECISCRTLHYFVQVDP
jgi:hypothetical protein